MLAKNPVDFHAGMKTGLGTGFRTRSGIYIQYPRPMKSNVSACILIALMAFLSSSCHKDKPEDLVYHDLTFNPASLLEQIPAGLKGSEDPYARLVYGDMAAMLDWGEFSDQLILPDSVTKTLSGAVAETYQWNLNTGSLFLLVNLTFSKAGNEYQWQEKIQYGPVGAPNEYLTAKEYEPGDSGSLQYNTRWFCGLNQLTDPCDPLYRQYKWKMIDNSSIFYQVKMKDQTLEPALNLEYRLILNTDGSGSVNATSGTEQYYHAAWNNLGSGIYSLYKGEVPETHEWNLP